MNIKTETDPTDRYHNARSQVQDALDELAAAAKECHTAAGSWRKAARLCGADESTLRHHANTGSKGRRTQYDA